MTSAASQSDAHRHRTTDRSRGIGRAVDRVLSGARARLRRGAAAPALLALLLASCSGPEQELVLLRGESMGTTWSAQIALEAGRHVEKAELVSLREALQAELDQVNAEMSTYLETSELARFNASSSTDWQLVSAPVAQICAQALEIGAKSNGLYDVTVGPLVELWGFGPGPHKGRTTVPSDAEIAAVLAVVGQAKLEVRTAPPALKKSVASLKVDLSSIAKGHGVDRLASKLDAAGFAAWFVEIGGEVRTRGEKTKGQPWRLGIERPSSGERAVQRLVELRDAAVATSGNYRNFFESGGQRYAHTLDPRTGRPAASSPASVSVFAATCAEADAWATALMALGAERGFEVAEREQVAALFLFPGANGGFEEKPTSAYHRFGRRHP